MIGVWCRRDRLGERLVIVLKSMPCTWGRCIFCPFAAEQAASLREVVEENRRLLDEASRLAERCKVSRVTVFNGGSFYELPLDTIVKLSRITRGRVVDIESRPEYLTLETLEETIRMLGARMLVVRVGLEVWDERLRNVYLRKGIPQSEVHRLHELLLDARRRGLPVKMLVYVLFGIEGVPEEKVVESVVEFNKLFDGVIAVRYMKYPSTRPRPVRVSEKLARFLEENCVMVDWGSGEEWTIAGVRGAAQDGG